jgi:tRNA(Ile)-lysidine synthase
MDLVSHACRAAFDQAAGAARIFVGFSGGMDSTVLLHALSRIREEAGSSIEVVGLHVNHGIAPDSDRWPAHCAATAERYGVRFVTETVAVESGSNLEARARRARYQVFSRRLEPASELWLAHHRDDAEESVLLHLLQGRGVFGMPGERRLGQGRLVRPLLDLPRSALAAYAQSRGLTWVEDPGNDDPSLDRNFLKQQILPELRERFPDLGRRLARVAGQVGDTARALEEVLDLHRHPLPLEVLDGLSHPAAVSVLRHWLVAQNAALGVGDTMLTEFLDQLGAANDRQPMLRIPAGALRRHQRQLYLTGLPPELAQEYQLTAPGELALPHGVLALTSQAGEGGLALRDVHPPVKVRFAEGGDQSLSLRTAGHQRRLRELMRQAGLPPWERELRPLLVDQVGLLAIAGVAARDPLPDQPGLAFGLDWRAAPWPGPGAS